MKGIVFNLLEEVVSGAYGSDCWYDIVDAAGVQGIYTSLGSYDDGELLALVAAVSDRLGWDHARVLRHFGRAAMPLLAHRYDVFFQPHTSSRSFVLSVNDIIHPEVRKLYSGAGCPHFDFRHEGDTLLLAYRSPRKLCMLAQGFAEGAADHYGEHVEVTHRECMGHGDPACLMALDWQG